MAVSLAMLIIFGVFLVTSIVAANHNHYAQASYDLLMSWMAAGLSVLEAYAFGRDGREEKG